MTVTEAENYLVFPTTGMAVADRAVLLAVDDVSLPLKRNLCYYLSRPAVRAEPVLTPSRHDPDAPDQLAADFYGTVLHDQGRFRMWYYACNVGRNPDWPAEVQAQQPTAPRDMWLGPVCYAESDDGIHWVKPPLRQMRFKGRLDHNGIYLPQVWTACATLIKDEHDPDASRRYKMAYWYQDGKNYANYPSFCTAVSADGIDWKLLDPRPTDFFIEHGSFYKFRGLYVVNGQSFTGSEGGGRTGRRGVVMVSPDFERWIQEWGDSFVLAEPADPQGRGMGHAYDQVHLGTGAAGFGNVMVGLYCIWHDNPVFGRISGDFGLLVSNDGLAFREPVKGHVFLAAADSPAPPVPGKDLPTILCQGNGILNLGDTTYIYHGRWRNAGDERTQPDFCVHDYYSEVALATLRRDRWGALGLFPDRADGSAWSAPVTLPRSGCAMTLNADGAAGIRVEVGDERFHLLQAFSAEHAAAAAGEEGLDCPVAWPAGSLAALAGRTVRFRLLLRKGPGLDPRLYAVYLHAGPGRG